MSAPDSAPQRAAHRWWEIPSGRAAQDGRYGDLLTGGHARVRPERSLTVGVEAAEEPSQPWRPYLWPIVGSVAAVITMIVLVVLAIVL